MARRSLLAVGFLLTTTVHVGATVPGGIEITCDVPRTDFRTASSGQTDVKFKLFSAPTGGAQIGSDYTVASTSLVVFKRYTEKFDSVSKRRALRVDAVIGNDASPVVLPVDGVAWLEIMVGSQTFGCDYAATGILPARRRLHATAFSQEGANCVARGSNAPNVHELQVSCYPGETATGGGCAISGAVTPLQASTPTTDDPPTGWSCTAIGTSDISAHAICCR